MTKNVIVYHGNLEHLREDLEGARETLNQRYIEILGPERAAIVADHADRLLLPTSFFDSPAAVQERTGASLGGDVVNKMLLFYPPGIKIRSNGRVKTKRVKTAAGFLISDEGFEHSHSASFTERPLASYVHEYDHFVWYALQRPPIYFVKMMLEEQRQKISPATTQGKKVRMALGMTIGVITDLFEKGNRVLDKMVLEAIDVDVPLPWRGKPKQYAQAYDSETHAVYMRVSGGDPFLGLSDQEAVECMINWQNRINIVKPAPPFVENLLESAKGMGIGKITLDGILGHK